MSKYIQDPFFTKKTEFSKQSLYKVNSEMSWSSVMGVNYVENIPVKCLAILHDL